MNFRRARKKKLKKGMSLWKKIGGKPVQKELEISSPKKEKTLLDNLLGGR